MTESAGRPAEPASPAPSTRVKSTPMPSNLGAWASTGLLLLRLGVGAMFIIMGYEKMMGGPDQWQKLGELGVEKTVGISWGLQVWGFMAAFAELVGGAAMVLGLLFRPMVFLMLVTMVAAAGMKVVTNLNAGFPDMILAGAHAINMGLVFLALLFIGPGDFALGRLIGPFRGRCWQ